MELLSKKNEELYELFVKIARGDRQLVFKTLFEPRPTPISIKEFARLIETRRNEAASPKPPQR